MNFPNSQTTLFYKKTAYAVVTFMYVVIRFTNANVSSTTSKPM